MGAILPRSIEQNKNIIAGRPHARGRPIGGGSLFRAPGLAIDLAIDKGPCRARFRDNGIMLSVVIATHDSECALLPTLAALVPGAAAGIVREVIVADAASPHPTPPLPHPPRSPLL